MGDRSIGCLKMADQNAHATILLSDYVREIAATDKMKPDIQPVLFGLFGEVGGIIVPRQHQWHRFEVVI